MNKLNELWKDIAIGAVTLIVAMLSFWLVDSRNYVKASDVTEIIKVQSPYNNDKELIKQAIIDFKEYQKEMKTLMEKQNETLNDMKEQIAVLNERLKNK